jgi:hypothetical protein
MSVKTKIKRKKPRKKAGSSLSPERGSLAAEAKASPLQPPPVLEEKKKEKEGKKRVDPYLPSPEAVTVLSNIVGSLEGLNLQDRGHVVARLKDLYFSSTKSGSKSKKNSSSAKQKKPQASKAPWKVLWHQSPEYRAWQEAIGAEVRVGDAEFNSLLQAAVQKRDALRTRFQSEPGGIPGETVSAPPASTSGGGGEATALHAEVQASLVIDDEDQDIYSEE